MDYIENLTEQQYVEVGPNIYLGSKDGMKYNLLQSSESKFRLVEVLGDTSNSFNLSKGSLSSVKKEHEKEDFNNLVAPKSESKLIKLMAVKSEPSPCKGQGDEIGNTVVSPANSLSDFQESNSNLEKVPLENVPKDMNSSSQLTYTTLLSKQENSECFTDICYNPPANQYYEYAPNYATPISIRPAPYMRKSRMQFSSRGSSISPITRARGRGPRQRRRRQTTYQYNPQVLHSTPSTRSNSARNSQLSFSGSRSSDYFDESQSSAEYPRVPNNTPNSSDLVETSHNQDIFSLQWMPEAESGVENYLSLNTRETHNEKERKRRLRIKNSCQAMRSLLPYVTDKTDNASVFEQAVFFISFMRETIGNELDMEFLEQAYLKN